MVRPKALACFAVVAALFSAIGLVEACATGVDNNPHDDASIGNDGGPDSITPGLDGSCPSGDTACYSGDGGKVCVNTSTDTNHCGNCTTSCIPQVELCTAGKCTSNCGSKALCIPDAGAGGDGGDAGDAAAPAPYCADLQSDSNNCGQCGNVCGAPCDAGVCTCSSGSKVFTYTGSMQTFVVPCGTSVTITVLGAQGANAVDVKSSAHTGGKGGSATGTLAVAPGQTLYVNVGGQGTTTGAGGWNGGGTGGSSTAGTGCSGGPAGGGGGMSDVRVGGTALGNIVIAAGGGGGSGRDYCNGTCVPCGCGGGNGGGGGTTGVSGGAASDCGFGHPGSGVNGGAGGTQSAGGNGGTGDGAGASGTGGTQGSGGGGAAGSYDVAGGGGGGGYYGGGGGGSAAVGSGVGGGGAGGGASYIGGVTSASTTAATQSGDGQITINWN